MGSGGGDRNKTSANRPQQTSFDDLLARAFDSITDQEANETSDAGTEAEETSSGDDQLPEDSESEANVTSSGESPDEVEEMSEEAESPTTEAPDPNRGDQTPTRRRKRRQAADTTSLLDELDSLGTGDYGRETTGETTVCLMTITSTAWEMEV